MIVALLNWKGDRLVARSTIDVTLGLRARTCVPTFQCGIIVVEVLRDLLSRQFPDDAGGSA